MLARKACGFDQAQPFFDAARLRAIAIVIENAFAPRLTEGGIFAARENRGILDGNAALVVVAVERPGLQLPARELSLVHQQMKRMLVVVALFADGVKASDELGFGEQGLGGFVGSDGHKSYSFPS